MDPLTKFSPSIEPSWFIKFRTFMIPDQFDYWIYWWHWFETNVAKTFYKTILKLWLTFLCYCHFLLIEIVRSRKHYQYMVHRIVVFERPYTCAMLSNVSRSKSNQLVNLEDLYQSNLPRENVQTVNKWNLLLNITRLRKLTK